MWTSGATGIPEEDTAPAHLLSQPLTLRDALHAAVTFDRPEEVKLAPLRVGVRGGTVEVAISELAMVSIEVRLS